MTFEPSVSQYPYRVGRMVYPTLHEAVASARAALRQYPGVPYLLVVNRKTGKSAKVSQ